MDKKTLPIIILLVALIFFYYPILEFLGLYEKPAESTKQVDQTTQTAPEVDTAADRTAQTPTEDLAEAQVQLDPDITGQMDEAVSDTIPVDTIKVETEYYTILMSSRGGGPVSMELKDYHYRDNGDIEMLPEAQAATPDARFAGGTYSTSDLTYGSNLRPGEYDATRDTLEVVYEYTNESGGIIRKTYWFYPDEYHYHLKFEVENTQSFGFERSYTLWWNTPLGVTEPVPENDYQAMQAVAKLGDSRDQLDDWEGQQLNESVDGYTKWVGVRNKFFTSALIPRNREGQAAIAKGYKHQVSTPDGNIEARELTAGVVMPFAGVSTIADSFTVYVGPMDYLVMDDYGVDLEAMLDIGTFPFFGTLILKPFAIAVMWLLPKLHDIVPNYGLVIILFAILVKIITLPLSMKQFKSMQGMKDLQPKMEELKKKHKKDPQALQRETMKLYKTHGVNPMSGCLVMLPQMPLMIAMFRVFQASILLRAEPLAWFIDDLSRGASSFTDPYMILVVLMVAMQMISSKLTMSSGQQQQKAFIYIFPVVIGFLLHSLPSGLILYWTVFSAMSLVDWALFKREKKVKNPEVKTA